MVEAVASAVDDNVVVVPAQSGEVVGVIGVAVLAVLDGVGCSR